MRQTWSPQLALVIATGVILLSWPCMAAPTVSITTPTPAPTFTATTSPITLGGTASDTIGVTQVTWSNSQGGSGTASGTTSWSASGIALQAGTNVLTVTARDGAGNTASATLTVTYTPPSGLRRHHQRRRLRQRFHGHSRQQSQLGRRAVWLGAELQRHLELRDDRPHDQSAQLDRLRLGL